MILVSLVLHCTKSVLKGYGFAIGNVAAFDMDDPLAVVSPGGVGFDINCGIKSKCLKMSLTNLKFKPNTNDLIL